MKADKIELSEVDNLLVFKKGYTLDFVTKTIREKHLAGIRIFSVLKDDELDDVDFLREYHFLEKLDIRSSTDLNFNFLTQLINLKKLTINVEGSNNIDLGNLPKLEYLSVKWRKNITGLERCVTLNSLSLIDFKEPDLEKLRLLRKLGDFRIKTSTIKSLDGVQDLQNLQNLTIGNCKKLSSIKQLGSLPNLQHLEFNICPNIKDYQSLNTLPNLTTLSLVDCGQIESLKFLEVLPSLSKLSLLGNTIVKDGNLLPAKRAKYIEYKHQKHYNIKLDTPSYDETIRSSLKRINDSFK